MSTDPLAPGGKVDLEQMALEDAKRIDAELARAVEEDQDDLFEPPSSEEVLEAREDLGPDAGALSIKRHIREKRKRGRPKGAKNKANKDVQDYLLQFGPHPAVAMMKVINETEEEMVERSRACDPAKKQLSWGEARGMRIRCMEGVRKVFVGDQPVQVDHTIQGVRIVEEARDPNAAAARVVHQLPKTLPPDDAEGGK